MLNKILYLSFCLLLLGACNNKSTNPTKGDEVELKLHFEKGDKHSLVMSIKQNIEQLMGSTPNTTIQNIETGYVMEAIAKENDIVSLKNTYDWNVFEITMMGNTTSYDSRKENEVNPLSQAMDAMTGKSFIMKFTEDGKINAIEGSNNIIDAIVDNMSTANEQQKAAMRQQMEKQFGEEAMMKNMAQMFLQYPKNPLKVGDSWEQKADIVSSFPMHAETTYILKTIDKANNIAILEIDGTIRSKEGAQLTSSGMTMDVEFSGTQKGETTIDLSNGMANLATLSQDIKGSITAMGQKVPMTIISEIIIKEVN
ncbi:MAG: hypothetical protein GY810_01440 [Aureispira sp.]|nr:hypothetical protein [Aureispira sp.]